MRPCGCHKTSGGETNGSPAPRKTNEVSYAGQITIPSLDIRTLATSTGSDRYLRLSLFLFFVFVFSSSSFDTALLHFITRSRKYDPFVGVIVQKKKKYIKKKLKRNPVGRFLFILPRGAREERTRKKSPEERSRRLTFHARSFLLVRVECAKCGAIQESRSSENRPSAPLRAAGGRRHRRRRSFVCCCCCAV